MPVSIYPPTLKSTQTAFLASTSVYPIYFSLQSITAFSDIGHVQVRIVRQANNKSIVDTTQYPDGAIYKSPSQIGTSGSYYYVSINSSELSETWQAGYLYKIQMRFGSTAMYTSVSNFATWKQEQIDNSTFSEWSNVMIIKAIADPEVTILNSEAVKQDVISTERTETTLTPLFTGQYTISDASNESIDQYKFDLYLGDSTDDLVETSGWLQHNAVVNTNDTYRFKTALTNNTTYTVVYSIITVNGYEKSSDPYVFLAATTYLAELEGVFISIEDDTAYCKENGCINIYCTTDGAISGNYVITRTSEESNYAVWEDLFYLVVSNQTYNNTLIYQDFTIESGIRYKYALQQENAAGLRTSPTYESASNLPHSVDLEYGYLYRDGVQLRLQFNQTLSSFKHTTLRTKQDTLGDQYPHLTQNGNAYYAEFPIAGIMTFQMDDDQTFFTLGSDGYYFDNELVIPLRKFEDRNLQRQASSSAGTNVPQSNGENIYEIDRNLTDDNIFVERKFREKAEAWLNDFSYKLYRSPTEGNIVICILSISMTPQSSLGKMIYNFSGTAYEVLDDTIENLNEYGIINVGEFTTLATDEITESFGQISGNFSNGTDLYSLIREAEEVSVGGGYKTNLYAVTEIWVEQYPIVDLTAEVLELEAERTDLLDAGENTSEVDAQIAELEALIEALEGPTAATIKISVDGTTVIVAPNKVYHLAQDISSLTLVESDVPIVINYVCELTQVEDTSVGVVSSIDASRIWGQISGVFTGTDSVLKAYNYDYKSSETYRIYSNNEPQSILIYDAQGDILVDNTNYNVYQTINLYDIIKEETQHQVELIYETTFEEDEDGELTDGSIYYTFNDITLFDIEADEGTTLYLSQNSDGSDAVTIKIGPTCRYTLNPSEGLIKYIALSEASYCLINYKCLTNQMTMSYS